MDNLPDEKEIVDTLGKTELLKVEDENLEVTLKSHNKISIQPKGTIFGAEIKVEENGNVTPMLTFDTKKLREEKKNIDVKSLLDDAIEDFWNEQV